MTLEHRNKATVWRWAGSAVEVGCPGSGGSTPLQCPGKTAVRLTDEIFILNEHLIVKHLAVASGCRRGWRCRAGRRRAGWCYQWWRLHSQWWEGRGKGHQRWRRSSRFIGEPQVECCSHSRADTTGEAAAASGTGERARRGASHMGISWSKAVRRVPQWGPALAPLPSQPCTRKHASRQAVQLAGSTTDGQQALTPHLAFCAQPAVERGSFSGQEVSAAFQLVAAVRTAAHTVAGVPLVGAK
jgi:hypothetical protein